MLRTDSFALPRTQGYELNCTGPSNKARHRSLSRRSRHATGRLICAIDLNCSIFPSGTVLNATASAPFGQGDAVFDKARSCAVMAKPLQA
jgi:hypothetical protein